ncbi:MAG: tetratricopeptide repeat protein [Saprospiraceae bacterium]
MKVFTVFILLLSYTLLGANPVNTPIKLSVKSQSSIHIYKGATNAANDFFYIPFDKRNIISGIDINGNKISEFRVDGEAIDVVLDEKTVYVLDAKDKSILSFDLKSGRLLTSYSGKGADKLKKPIGLGLLSNGQQVVLDASKNKLFYFDSKGNLLQSITLNGIVDPVNFQIDGNDNLYVFDEKLDAIVKFSSDGKPLDNGRLYVDAIRLDDKKGKIDGFLLDPLGYLWVVNTSMKEVQTFSWNERPIMIYSASAKDGLQVDKLEAISLNPSNYELQVLADKKLKSFDINIPVETPPNLFGFDIDGEKLIVAFKKDLPNASHFGLVTEDIQGNDSLAFLSNGKPFEIIEQNIKGDHARRYKLIAMNPSTKSQATSGFDNFFGQGNTLKKLNRPAEAFAAYQNALRYMGRPVKMVQYVSISMIDLGKDLIASNVDMIKGLNVLKTAYNLNPREPVIQKGLAQGFNSLFWRLAAQESYQAIIDESGKVVSQTFLKPYILQNIDSIATVLEKLNTISALTNARMLRASMVEWAPEQTSVWKGVYQLDMNLYNLKLKSDAPDYELQALTGEGERHILKAIDLLQKSNKPFIPEYLLYLQTLEFGKKYADLEKYSRAALESFSNRLDANQSLQIKEFQAIGLMGMEKYDESLKAYQYLLSQKPNENKWKLKLADVLYANNNSAEALSLYKQLLLNERENPDYLAKIGLTELAVGNSGEASIQLEKAIKLDPTNKSFLGPLGEAYEATGNNEKAIDNYKLAVNFFTQAMKNSGSMSYKQSAEKLYKYQEKLANLYVRVNQFDDAAEIYKKLTSIFPSNASYWYGLGQSVLSKGFVYDAVNAFEKAQSLSPANSEYQNALSSSIELRSKVSKNEDPLSIAELRLVDIYPSLYVNYGEVSLLPVGNITLTNNTQLPIRYSQISLEIPEIMKEATIQSGGVITAFSNNTINLAAIFSSNILNYKQGQKLQAKVTINYNYNGSPKTGSMTRPVNINGRNNINWADKRRIASFINIGPGPVADYASASSKLFENVTKVQLPDNLAKAMQLYSMLHLEKLNYIPDPDLSYSSVSSNTNLIDFIQYPGETMQRKGGDCDDLVSLYSSVMENAGISTAFIDVPGHIFLAFDLNIHPADIDLLGFSARDLIVSQGKVWVPVETTLLGTNSFSDAWQSAAKRYNLEINKGNYPDLVPMADARKAYRPSQYNPTNDIYSTYKPVDVIKDFQAESYKVFAKLNEGSLTTLKNQFLYEPYNVFIKNKYAVVLAQAGRTSEAKQILKDAMSFAPSNASILNNLGNIAVQEGNLQEAVNLYEKSYSFDNSDFQTAMNLVKVCINLNDKIASKKWLDITSSLDSRFTEYFNKLINQIK